MKKFIISKKIRITVEPILCFIYQAFKRLYKFIFTKRTILFVTNQKIRSITFGPFSQAFCYIFMAWIINLFIQSLNYDKIINSKSEEINKLKTANNFFHKEFQIVNEKLEKVNQYIITITGSPQKVNNQPQRDSQPLQIDENSIEKKDKNTLYEIKNSRDKFLAFSNATEYRIKKIENALNGTGLAIKRPKVDLKNINQSTQLREYSLNNKSEARKLFKGGPKNGFDSEIDNELSQKELSSPDFIEAKIEQAKFNNEIDYLIVLEKLVKSLPLSMPMKNFYITSGFGTRIDPITHQHTPHRGLDFVGSNHEKIISPSPGRIVLARWFSDYGNAIVIDHGNGITTRYGHLSKIKVFEGQRVKNGEVIGYQGNTGRSTGQHLHYEVRYRNIPLNPKRFIEAGQILINNNSPKHVDI